VGRISSLPLTLTVAAQAQTVEVQALAATLETSQSALNAVVNTRAVQEMPLNGRDFRQLLTLTPGFNQSFSMNGNRSNQNNWQIDGVHNNASGTTPRPSIKAASRDCGRVAADRRHRPVQPVSLGRR